MATVIPDIQYDNASGVDAPRFDKLGDWLAWQEDLHFTAIDLGLDRCKEVAEKMGLFKFDFKVISVAGTNGKGSSVAMLDLILRNSAYITGKYTSPHLLRYNERICINNVEVDSELLCQSFDRIDKARGNISLTYFEFGTLAALDIFQQAGVDIAIMEVGLGGRLDAVNILDADAALVTSLDIDHENWLGSDRETIAKEKAGIFRAGKPAVCSDPNPPNSMLEYAKQEGTKLDLLQQDYFYKVYDDHWDWRSGEIEYKGLAKPSPYDSCQMQNAAGVLQLLSLLGEYMPMSEEAVYTSMQDFRLNGRFQLIPGEVPFILDVAHNRQAAATLVANLGKIPATGRTHCVVGMLKDKNHAQVFAELEKAVDCWYLAELGSDRAAATKDLAASLSSQPGSPLPSTCNDVKTALDQAKQAAGPGDRIVITGSFLTVKEGLHWLGMDH